LTDKKKPTAEEITAAKERLVRAQKVRKKDRIAADLKFWESVADEIDSGNCRQVDAVEALEFNRDYIRRNVKQIPDLQQQLEELLQELAEEN
jgi:hypothetical protein